MKHRTQATETILSALIEYIKQEHGYEVVSTSRPDLLVVESNTEHPAEPYIYIWLDYKRQDSNGHQYYDHSHLKEHMFHIEFGHHYPRKSDATTQYVSSNNIFDMFNTVDEYCVNMKRGNDTLISILKSVN